MSNFRTTLRNSVGKTTEVIIPREQAHALFRRLERFLFTPEFTAQRVVVMDAEYANYEGSEDDFGDVAIIFYDEDGVECRVFMGVAAAQIFGHALTQAGADIMLDNIMLLGDELDTKEADRYLDVLGERFLEVDAKYRDRMIHKITAVTNKMRELKSRKPSVSGLAEAILRSIFEAAPRRKHPESVERDQSGLRRVLFFAPEGFEGAFKDLNLDLEN